jgi:hypothetical protein
MKNIMNNKKIKYTIAAFSILFVTGIVLYKPVIEMLEQQLLRQQQLKQETQQREQKVLLEQGKRNACIEREKTQLKDPNSLVFIKIISNYYGDACFEFEYTATNSYGGRVKGEGVCGFTPFDSVKIDAEKTKRCAAEAVFQRMNKELMESLESIN